MRRRLIAILAAALTLVTASTIAPLAALARTVSPTNPGLPSDGPRALYRAEPHLPAATGWPASNNAFPRTSGTGRYADGAYYWTDFLYDDHGTTTASTGGISVTAGTPSFGTYTYPPGAADQNGADIFRAAVALRPHATYWRVDWTTLTDGRVPIAEWTFNTDHSDNTGVSDWPGAAGVHSPGVDAALIMSGTHADFIKEPGARVTRLPVTVDLRAHSFVVRVPDHVFPRNGLSTEIRLVSGLADSDGTGFRPAPDAVPGQTRAYNVAFRNRTQEPKGTNFWDDESQTEHLLTGNVTPFVLRLYWAAMRRHDHQPQPNPSGWSDRWYISSADPGEGVITDAASDADGKANYLGSVQPYAIYLPHGVRHRRKVPLTFLLHSSNQNHNQYAATTPNFVRAACEERHSICVTPLGRGPDGNYFGTAELDFWQVWHAVATQFHLDPNRTIIAGYSMGGTGSNQLVMEHPDLFARSITLAGGIGDVDSLVNLRWVPTYLAGGAEDELVPVTLQAGEANTLEQLGYRFRWIIVTAIDHVSYELADSFADAVRYMGQNAKRMLHPGRIDFTWTPSNTPPPTGVSVASPPGIGWTQRRFLGVTTTGAYWLHDLRARSKQVDGHIVARSGERPDRAVSPHATQTVDPTFAPDPAAITQQTWHRRQRPVKRPVITLHLRNVRSLAVLLRDAGFRHGTVGHLHVTTDGRTAIALGNRIHRFATGTHVIRFRA